MKVTISVRDLFKGEAVGGLEINDWKDYFYGWEVLSDEERLKQRLLFITSRAGVLYETACNADNGMPGNVSADAQRLQQTAASALVAAHERDFLTASGLALDAGRIMAEINALLPTYDRLKVTIIQREGNRKGGKARKRKDWAEELAEYLNGLEVSFPKAWAHIPEDENNPLELTEDLAVYRSDEGRKVVAVDLITDKEIGRPLAQSSFQKRYFQKAKQNPDSN